MSGLPGPEEGDVPRNLSVPTHRPGYGDVPGWAVPTQDPGTVECEAARGARADNRFGYENDAQATTLRALQLLLHNERKRSKTIQFMPEADSVRVEVIRVDDGEYEAIVDVREDGSLAVRLDA